MDDIKTVLDRLDQIQKNQIDHQERSEKTSVRVQRIERFLKGDEEFGQKGLIHDVRETRTIADDTSQKFQKYKNDEKIRAAKKTGIFMGLGLAGGGLGAWLKQLLGF